LSSAAGAIGLVGLFNIAGSLIWGWLGSRYPKKETLALLYALRAFAFMMFLALPLSWMSVLLFSASLGFLWLGASGSEGKDRDEGLALAAPATPFPTARLGELVRARRRGTSTR
jgi:MFS family permease